MDQPIRILHVLGSVNLGGAESRIMDLYRAIDRTKIQFDFLVHTKEKGYFQEEIEALGGIVYSMPRFKGYNLQSYQTAWKQFFKEHKEFQAVHGHMTSTASIYLPIAKRAGVFVTIAHARSAGTDPGFKGTLTKFLRRKLAQKADVCLACSELAGEAVFGTKAMKEGKVFLLPNGIATEKYAWNPRKREELRKELGISNQLVIGHVGRFHYAKNHSFLISIFEALLKQKKDAILLLLGEGILMEECKEQARTAGIAEQIMFLGNKSKIEDYYQVMDYVIFPSRFEGMPGTIVEAQATGLPVLVSDRVTREVQATSLVTFFSLAKSPEEWANEVLSHSTYERTDRREELIQKGFDVKSQVTILQTIYQSGDIQTAKSTKEDGWEL